MSNLHLVVFTGLPSDGKTSIAKRLQERGCGYVSTDLVRQEIYPGRTPLEIEYPRYWEPIWESVCETRNVELENGRHVLIDSCAQNKYIRDRFFTVPEHLEKLFNIYRELVWMHVDEDELLRREERRGRDPDEIRRIMEAMQTDFQDPRDYSFLNTELVEYPNNTMENHESIVADLGRRMGLVHE